MLLIRRALAYALDYLILTTLMITFFSFLKMDISGLLLIFLGVFVGYYFSCYMWFGTTAGERLFKLRVIADDNQCESAKPEASAFLFRSIGLFFISVIPILCLVIFLPKKRSVADRMSMTKVVMARTVPKQANAS